MFLASPAAGKTGPVSRQLTPPNSLPPTTGLIHPMWTVRPFPGDRHAALRAGLTAVAGVEAGQLLQHPDQAVGGVARLLEVETQPGRAAVGLVAQGGGHGGLLPAEPVPQDRGAAPW